MSGSVITLIVVVVVILIIVFFVWNLYNSLVTSRMRVKESWSGIDVQLKRRADLIPNLLETVKSYASHEKEVFQKVTQARTSLMGAQNAKDAAQADNILTGALKSLFAVAEDYPELRASENFKELQDELSDTETKIAASRQFYNSNVLDYNTKIQVFPNSLLAGTFGFTSSEFFEAVVGDKEPVKVKF